MGAAPCAGDGLVVVGASLAGLRAVEAARRQGFDGPVTLVGAEEHPPYDRPPLSKDFLGAGAPPSPPPFRTEEHLRDELGVTLRLGTRATGLDTDARSVVLDGEEVPYGRLVVATGAVARTMPGAEHLVGVHTLRTADDAAAVRSALDVGARTVVVGAGFIGSEVAAAARARDLPVTIVETAPVPLTRSLGDDTGRAVADLHRAHGTDLRCGVSVVRLEGENGRIRRVVLDDGTTLDADLVVVGIGVLPGTGWLEDSGVALHDHDRGVLCNETLSTSVPGVWAAGDVAHWPHPLFDGRVLRLEHWSNAAEQGALAVRNALSGEPPKPAGAVPYFWSDLYGSRLQFVGVPAADEVRVVSEETGDDRFLALYRTGDRLTGTVTLDRPAQVMKYRRLVAQRATWGEALTFAGVEDTVAPVREGVHR